MINRIAKSFSEEVENNEVRPRDLGRILNRIAIHHAMIETGGNFTEATKILGISRSSGRKYLDMTQKEWAYKYRALI